MASSCVMECGEKVGSSMCRMTGREGSRCINGELGGAASKFKKEYGYVPIPENSPCLLYLHSK